MRISLHKLNTSIGFWRHIVHVPGLKRAWTLFNKCNEHH